VFCSGEIVSFSETVIVKLEVCEEGTIGDDVAALKDTFVSTCNGLAMESFDPYFRFLETAQLTELLSLTSEGNLPVEVLGTGKYRSCDPKEISVYYFPITTEPIWPVFW
jgi:hypothetical protein